MANKRRRTEVEIESDSDSSQSDSQQPSANKRTRVTQSRANGRSPDPNDSDLEAVDAYNYTYTSRVEDDNTMYLDVSSDDEGEADPETELRATQMVQQHFQEHKENMPSEQGIIEEVYMYNFMCHGKLRIALGPLINFIVGHNGSGKSAILTALTVCLGAKATATSRAANLKSFIKTGEESSYVAVKIKNQGENAYQPEVYGKSIIVERHFSKSGTSGFKLKNSEGRIVSTKKAELENIVDFFALQLDNPMNVLSQDLARQFLSNSTPNDKYKFFIRGTQLEALDADYRMIEETVDGIEQKCETREQDVQTLAEVAREAGEKKKLIDRSQSIQEKITQLTWQHAWAQVEEQEQELVKMDNDIHKIDNRIAMLQSKADDASRIYEESHQSREANESVIQDLEADQVPLRETFDEIKAQFDHNKNEMLNKKTEQRTIREDMKGAQKIIADLQSKIEIERNRIENANGPAHARKITELEEARNNLQECIQREEQHGAERTQLNSESIRAGEEAKEAKPAVQQKLQAISEAQQMLRSLESDKGQQMRAFNPSILNVVNAMNRTQGFRDKPVGPMGLHVRLLKPEWGSIIESTFGAQMEAFIVTNKADQAILSRIVKQFNCNSNIIIQAPRRIPQLNEPAENVATILRVLEIDNELVLKALVINQMIDQTALVADKNKATDFQYSKPPHVKVTLAHNTNLRGAGWRYELTRSNAIKSGPVRAWGRQMRMKTSAEAQINMAKENINDLKREHQELEKRARDLETIATRAKQAVVRHEREAKELRQKRQRLEDRIEGLQSELDRDAANDTSALDEFHAQITEAEGSYKAAQDTFQDSVNALDRLGNEQRGVKNDMDAASKALEEAVLKINKAKNRFAQKQNEREFALRAKNEALQIVDVAKGDKERKQEERDTQANLIQNDYIPQAESISLRVTVDPGNTLDVLDKKLESLVRERDQFNRRVGGSREEIYEKWRVAHKDFTRAQRDLNNLRDTSKKLKTTLLNRKGRWKLFRKYITTRAKITFGYLLAERNFRGKILVNHADKALDISVEPDISKSSDRGRQTRTLSGGEKSFSTICLLLSIWEAMGSPIRCLDEFDVFMDSANREVSMKMMISAARRSVGRQFVLITPQSMGKYTEGLADVNVHKMADPERGQRTLPYERE